MGPRGHAGPRPQGHHPRHHALARRRRPEPRPGGRAAASAAQARPARVRAAHRPHVGAHQRRRTRRTSKPTSAPSPATSTRSTRGSPRACSAGRRRTRPTCRSSARCVSSSASRDVRPLLAGRPCQALIARYFPPGSRRHPRGDAPARVGSRPPARTRASGGPASRTPSCGSSTTERIRQPRPRRRHQVEVELEQRDQDEAARQELRVRQRHPLRLVLDALHQQHVDVDLARPLRHPPARGRHRARRPCTRRAAPPAPARSRSAGRR